MPGKQWDPLGQRQDGQEEREGKCSLDILQVKLTGHGSSLEIEEQENYLGVQNDPEVSD